MNPQANNNPLAPNSNGQQPQFSYNATGLTNPMLQDGANPNWQTFLSQQDREGIIAKFAQAISHHNLPQDRVILTARALELQCYQAAPGLQQYYMLCSQKFNTLSNASQNMKQFIQQQQQQVPQQLQNQLQQQQMQGQQAQQLANQAALSQHMQLQQQNLPAQAQHLQELQRQKIFAQMQQNMAMNAPNSSNFLSPNIMPGVMNAPSLGRPRPVGQSAPGGQIFPGSTVANESNILSPVAAGQPIRNMSLAQLSTMSPQMFTQYANNPAFLAMLQRQGITPIQVKNAIIAHAQAQAANHANRPGASMNHQANSAANQQASASASNTPNALPQGPLNTNLNMSPAFPKGNMSEPDAANFASQTLKSPQNTSQPPTSLIQSATSSFAPSPNNIAQAHMLAQRQAQMLEAAKANNQAKPSEPHSGGPLPGSSSQASPATNLVAMGQRLRGALESAKADLETKYKSMHDSFSPPNVRDDVTKEEAEKITTFFKTSAPFLKQVEELIPYTYVFTNTIDNPRLLVNFKLMLEYQLRMLPKICITWASIEAIIISVNKAKEYVRMRLQNMSQTAAANDASDNNSNVIPATSATTSTSIHPAASVSFSATTQSNSLTITATTTNANPVITAIEAPSQPALQQNVKSAPIQRPEPAPQGETEAKRSLPAATPEPVQGFKSHIPNADIALKLPPQKAAATPTAKAAATLQQPPKEQAIRPPAVLSPPGSQQQPAQVNPPISTVNPVSQRPIQPPPAPSAVPSATASAVSARLNRIEGIMISTRNRFNGQALAYATETCKALRKTPGRCQIRLNPPSNLGGIGPSLLNSPDVFHYGPTGSYSDQSPLSNLLSARHQLRRSVVGFGDCNSASSDTSKI